MAAWLRIATVGFCLAALTGCGQGTVQDALGMGKRSPDEFAVLSRAPLILPPDFDLRPPGADGVARPGGTTADRARATLTGGVAEPAPDVAPATESLMSAAPPAEPDSEPVTSTSAPASSESAGEAALLRQTGAAGSDPGIRTRLADEGAGPAEVEPALFERLMDHPAGAAGSDDGMSPAIVRRDQTEINLLQEPEN